MSLWVPRVSLPVPAPLSLPGDRRGPEGGAGGCSGSPSPTFPIQARIPHGSHREVFLIPVSPVRLNPHGASEEQNQPVASGGEAEAGSSK